MFLAIKCIQLDALSQIIRLFSLMVWMTFGLKFESYLMNFLSFFEALYKNNDLMFSHGSNLFTDIASSALDKNGIFNMILEQVRFQKPEKTVTQ